MSLHHYREYKYRPILDVAHLSVERPFKNKHFSAGIDLIYSSFKPALPDYYRRIVDPDDYYDRTMALGVFGRVYTKPGVYRGFFQATVYGNYVHIYQLIVIRQFYGTYHEEIDYKDFLMGGAFAIGFSFTHNRLSYEPYIQFGFVEAPAQRRGHSAVIGSVGRLGRDAQTSFMIVPLCIKVQLY